MCTFGPSVLPLVHAFFFFNHPATTEIYTLSLHDALPISVESTVSNAVMADFVSPCHRKCRRTSPIRYHGPSFSRSEEHTSELQSHSDLVCRLLLEKKNRTSSLRSGSNRSRVQRCLTTDGS